MTSTIDKNAHRTHQIPGWDRPQWATGTYKDDGLVTFTRDAETLPTELTGPDDELLPAQVTLMRMDTIQVNSDDGTMSIDQGLVVICFEIEELVPAEARKFAQALIELADAAESE